MEYRASRKLGGRRHQSRRSFGQRATYSARGQEVDPQIGAGGDHDKVQFTPKSKYVNPELVSVAKKLTKGRRMQRAERHGVFFPPGSSRQSSLFFKLATFIACKEQFMFHAVTERKFFLKTLLKTTRMLKCLFRALWI